MTGTTKSAILGSLAGGKPESHRGIVKKTGLSGPAVWSGLMRLWMGGVILRTKEPIRQSEKIFKGRGGTSRNLRSYYLYILKPEGRGPLLLDGREFVGFSKEYLDVRGGGKKSKAKLILEFLKKNRGKAWFSTDIVGALKDKGIKVRDVMSSLRRYERKGAVYIRGYRTEDRQTPFQDGYLITWIDHSKPREKALGEAIRRTDLALERRGESLPIVQRINRIRDTVIESSKLGELVSPGYIQNKLGCTPDELEKALQRVKQLYPDLGEIKLFNVYRYFYHSSMPQKKLEAAVKMKENYIRKVRGRDHRVGHNWEAVPEWFLDKFTAGAKFWTQEHRGNRMDPRRITLYLIKQVGGRRSAAEVDRVWEVTPGVFANPVIYVLSCKWGLVKKAHVDDFLEVLRWSKEFGTDSPQGRQVRQGVIGVFAGNSFDPREKVKMRDGTEVSLPSYAGRMNIQLLKAADFNQKLHGQGCPGQVTVQKICRVAKHEGEVREMLDAIWEEPKRGEEILDKAMEKNKELYKFERMLEESR